MGSDLLKVFRQLERALSGGIFLFFNQQGKSFSAYSCVASFWEVSLGA